jgi:hypothetical protein
MRYEPTMKEPAAPRAIRPGIISPWRASAPRAGDGGESRSRQSAELDIWEDDSGRQVDSTPDWIVERHCHELAG